VREILSKMSCGTINQSQGLDKMIMVERRRKTIKKHRYLGRGYEEIRAVVIIPFDNITTEEAIELLSNEENDGYFDGDREALIYWKKD